MITIDVKSALIYLLLIALIVFVIYLIVMAKNLIQTIKSLNIVLKDTEEITKIASERVVQLDGVADEVQEAVSEVAKSVKGRQNIIEALTNIVKTFGSVSSVVNKKVAEEPKMKRRK